METSTFLKVFLGCAALVMALEISYLVRSRAYADPGGAPTLNETTRAARRSVGTAAHPAFGEESASLDGCEAPAESGPEDVPKSRA